MEEFRKLGALPDPSIDTPAKVLANVTRMAEAERAFLVRTGRLQR